jgi:hypothetical protein
MCLPNPCNNGATCFNVADGYFCQCTDEFGGQNCSVKRVSYSQGLCLLGCLINVIWFTKTLSREGLWLGLGKGLGLV